MTNQNITEEIKAVLGTGYENAESFSQEQSYLNAIQQFGIENISIENKGAVTNETYVITLRSNWNEAELWSEIDQAYVDANFSYNPETGFNVATVFKFSNDVSEVQFNASTGEYQLVSKANQKVISAGAILDQDGNVSTSFKIGDLLSFAGTTGLNNENVKLSGKIDLDKIAGELNFAQNEDGSSSAGILGIIDNNTDFDGIGFKLEKVATDIDVIGIAAEYFDALPGQIPSNFATWTYDTFMALGSDPVLSEMTSGQYAITMQEYRTAIESGMEDFGWSLARAHQKVIEGWEDFLTEQPNLDPSVTSADYITDSIVLRPAPVGVQLNTYTEPTGTSLLEVIQGGVVDGNGNEIPASNGVKVLMPDENGNLVEQVLVSSETLEAVAEDLGISSADLINRAANNYIAGKQTAVDAGNGHYMYTFFDGEKWDITPADNDATYSLAVNLDADNSTYIAPDAYTSLMDLEVDLSESTQTADEALSEVPLTSGLPPKAIVGDGTNATEYKGYGNGLDGKDALEELGVTNPSVTVVKKPVYDAQGNPTGEEVPVGTYAKIDQQQVINGKPYYETDILDSLSEASQAVATFISTQTEQAAEWFSNPNGAQIDFAEWLGANIEDLIDGNISSEQAFIDLAEFLGERYIAHQITGTLTQSEAYNLMVDSLATEFNLTIPEAGAIATGMATALTNIAIEFANAGGNWSSEDYVNAGVAATTAVVANHYAKSYFGENAGLEVSATVAAVTTAVVGLLESGEYNSSDYVMLGVNIGVASGAAAVGSIVGGIEALGILGGPAGILAGAAVGIIASNVISSIYTGKKFYQGEFGDKGALLDTIYQIQDIDTGEVDGNGDPITVQALVATNANGSTIELSNFDNITYAIGSQGADILVGDDTGDVMSGGDGSDYIEGKEGDEQISGDGGNDHLIGAEGDDVIQGGDGNDIIFGDAGEDTIIGGDGQDFIHGGGDNDAILGGLERDTILASGGNDVVQGDAGDDMIDGGYGDDLLDGGDGNDLLLGNLGNDSVTGGAGDDKIFGDAGNDSIMGDAGDDFINGGAGVDILEGGNGADLIYGDSGDDFLQGDLGDDDLVGGLGDDVILGGLDDDYLYGMGGNDELTGGLGDDVILGGFGQDTLIGDAGNDVYILSADDSGVSGNDNIIDSEGSSDKIYINNLDSSNVANLTMSKDGDNLVISYNAVAIATVVKHFVAGDANAIERIEFDDDQLIDLSSITVDGATSDVNYTVTTDSAQTTKAGIDLREDAIDSNLTLQSQFWNNAFLQNLSETAYEEALRDQIENEYYNGSDITEFKRSRGMFGGHYKVYRLQQSDDLEGSAEITKFEELEPGYNSADYVSVQTGEKIVNFDVSYTLTTEFGSWYYNDGIVADIWANNQLLATNFYYSIDHYNAVTGYEVFGGGVPVETDGTFNYGHFALNGSASSRQGNGDSTNIEIGESVVSSGSDHLVGSWWNETINGGTGDDALFGGDGDDTINGDGGDDWLFGGDGEDDVDGGTGDDSIFGGDGNDDLTGGDGADAIFGGDGDDYISGGDGADWIDAGEGADIIIGGAGDDIIYAGGGDDYAEGGDGLDVIYGQGGDDIIYGNLGIDWLYGESGNDTILGVEDSDHLYGGTGVDTISYALSDSGVNIDLANGTASGGYAEGDTFYDFERIKGSDHDDNLTGIDGGTRVWGYAGEDIINGGNGKDFLYGGNDNDTINGGDERDYIWGNGGNDIQNGDGGNDLLYGSGGNDILDGGAGSDYAYYRYSDSGVNVNLTTGVVSGGDAEGDTIISIERVYGSEYTDNIVGNDEINYVYTRAGADIVDMKGGDDHVFAYGEGANINGGAGIDIIRYSGLGSSFSVSVNLAQGTAQYLGGTFADTISNFEEVQGSQGDDTILGDTNNNTFYGYDGDDTFSGSAGNDILYGENGDDVVNGNSGNDTLYGNSGNDNLNGGLDNDTLYGGSGADMINGGSGDDTIYADSGNDVIDGGDGNDTLSFASYSNNLTIDLANNTANSASTGLDFITNVEQILSGSGDDNIIGSSSEDVIDGYIGDDYIYGRDGDDQLFGHEGVDYIYGESGNDTIDGGSSSDYLYGGDGNDTISGGGSRDYIWGDDGNDTQNGEGGDDLLYGSNGDDILDGGAGSDYAYYRYSDSGVNVNLTTGTVSGGYAEGDTLTSIERVYGSEYTDNIVGTDSQNYVYTRAGLDQVDMMGGDDHVFASAVGATIEGGNGVDRIRYSMLDDSNSMIIDLGNDIATNSTTSLSDNIFNFEEVQGSQGDDTILGDANDNTFYGYDGDDTFSGSAGNDILYGENGDDVVNGNSGNDTLYGNSGNDNLNGGLDNDTLYGGSGADMINGGAGIDNLYGESGSDVFVFIDLTHSTDTAQDIIQDFVKGDDQIDLTAFSFTSISDFAISQSSGDTIVDDNSSTFSFKLDGSISLDDNDFIFS